MITAVDTNVLLDVLIPGAPHGAVSRQALGEALQLGALVISEPVYAEVAGRFPQQSEMDRFLTATSLQLASSSQETLFQAGRAWSDYLRQRPVTLTCPQCGAPQRVSCQRCGASIQARQRVVADFIIGAHATVQANRLLTRDRGYYATYFPELPLG